jgi:TolB-like protein/DNA-binding winged helix-turn-helix (wHTH) protein
MPVAVLPLTRVSFCGFELDCSSGELHKNGQKVPLPPKAFEVLHALAERPGEVVTREELRAKLWAADTFVEFDDSLNHAVKKLRQVLGDSADNPRFIETLPRYGYRFIATIEAEPHPEVLHAPRSKRRAVIGIAIVGAVFLAALVGFWALRSNIGGDRVSRNGVGSQLQSLAVLPLANLSGDPQQDYFAEGMTDALITDLAKLHAAKVISRTSVMRFKDTRQPLPEIARSLGVDGILEGSVQRSSGRVRITVQLIHAPTDTHLWAESYERDTRDVISLEGEIAQAIAREIKVVLTPEESSHLGQTGTVNPEAYDAYLKGQSHWYRLSREHIDMALGYFELALQKDPNYARAYVGIGNVWMMRADAGFMLPTEAFPKAKAAAGTALRLDDNLPDAHILLGNIVGPYEHDWAQAEYEFRRAIELNPNSSDGHFFYSDFLISTKREAEWKQEIQRTLELDPFNPFYQCFYGWHLVYLGRNDEAITQLRKVMAANPEFSSAHLGLWGAYYKKGMLGEALEEARTFFAVLGDHEVESVLSRGYATHNYARAMHLGAEMLAARSRHSYVPAIRIARLYAHAGDKDQVMTWLEKAYDRRESPLGHLGVAWDWDGLRDDPRFGELVRRSGLPQ